MFRLEVKDAYDTKFGLQFGTGLSIRMSARINLLIEPNYVLVFDDGENIQYFPLRLGVALHV